MFQGVNHVNVVVSDIDRAKEFYRDVVGLTIDEEFQVSDPELSRGLAVPDATLNAVFWNLPNSETRIEMIEYVAPPARELDASLLANRVGYGHLAFTVTDIDEAYGALKERGAPFVSPPVLVPGNVRFCWFKDPDGNLLEIIQPAT